MQMGRESQTGLIKMFVRVVADCQSADLLFLFSWD